MRLGLLGGGVVAGSVAGGIGAAYLLRFLYRNREKPGPFWFSGNIAAVTVFCFCYGLSLLLFDPTVRWAAEVISFVCLSFMGPFFLAFGLAYTGRTDLLRAPPFAVVAGVPLLTVVLAATNPVHGLVWTGFRLEPVFGLATVQYTVGPWGLVALLFSIGTAAVGSLLLIGTVLSYGPLYRREATAVTLSTVPPTLGVSLWLSGLGPAPALNLTAPLMVVHVALDGYAFVGTHMFDTSPATQRVAEQTGLDKLTEPVLVLDFRERVVKFNDSAERVFGRSTADGLVPLSTLVGADLSAIREAGEVEVDGPDGGVFAVSYTPLADPADNPVGGMVVLYDLREERQRKQQLSVLNRVLRHNLRNEMTVIQGYAETLEAGVDDPDLQDQAATISRAGDRLLGIGEKVREFDRIQDTVTYPKPVDLAAMTERLERTLRRRFPDAAIETEIDAPEPTVETQPDILELALTNLLENALKHADADPTVTLRVQTRTTDADGPSTVVDVADTNDPIPETEIAVIRAGAETPLQHAQGIGLWIVNWCVATLNGTLDYRYDDGNRFTIRLPSG